MKRIVIELTDRCNLRCRHCPDDRHGGKGDLPMAIIDEVLTNAMAHGFEELAFTGGEPTIHKRFLEVIDKANATGYSWGFVSNGWNFPKIYADLLRYPEHFTGVTFSMDGATEKTHDALRGPGSFRRLLKAMSICMFKDIPFAINMVITRENHTELAEQVEFAARLGSRGVRFGHFLSTSNEDSELALSPTEKCAIGASIRELQQTAPITVAMAPGYYTETLFPCDPLQLQEFNIDWHGNVTKCCHLSGYGQGAGQEDVIGNLADIGFTEALARLTKANDLFRQHKQAQHDANEMNPADYFPCQYCCHYYHKLEGSPEIPTAQLAVSAKGI